MYGATADSLLGLLIFYSAGFLAFSFCLAAIFMLLSGDARKSPMLLAVGSLACSAFSGISFLALLSSGILSKNAGGSLGYLLLIPILGSAIICWYASRASK